MKTKKAAVQDRSKRKEDHGTGGPRRYILTPPPGETEGLPGYGMRTHAPRLAEISALSPGEGGMHPPGHSGGRGFEGALANRAKADRPEAEFVLQSARSQTENPFRKRTNHGQAQASKHKVGLPQEFVEWAEHRGFSPALAARFVLAWFCERESVDRSSKVQYTCGNTTWQTNGPKTKKMSP